MISFPVRNSLFAIAEVWLPISDHLTTYPGWESSLLRGISIDLYNSITTFLLLLILYLLVVQLLGTVTYSLWIASCYAWMKAFLADLLFSFVIVELNCIIKVEVRWIQGISQQIFPTGLKSHCQNLFKKGALNIDQQSIEGREKNPHQALD